MQTSGCRHGQSRAGLLAGLKGEPSTPGTGLQLSEHIQPNTEGKYARLPGAVGGGGTRRLLPLGLSRAGGLSVVTWGHGLARISELPWAAVARS